MWPDNTTTMRSMKKNIIVYMLACLFVIGCSISFGGANRHDARIVPAPATDPLRATYIIEGQEIRLIDGRCETESAPGSASKTITSVFGKPVYGNIDGKGDVDAALVLTFDPGGSGTFFYVAAALDVDGIFLGTRAILLGDRVAPQKISIRNGLIVANYADRTTGEPMAVPSSVGRSKYLVLDRNEIKEIPPLTEAEVVLDGWVTIGHEVRTFFPCSQARELWLLGNSPALNEVMTTYREALPGLKPYTPLFMTLAGKTAGPTPEGFGAEYEASFFASQLVQVFPQGNCESDLIYVDSPLPGSRIASPLKIWGHARGNWFFEGDFPVALVDTDGKMITQGYATAKNGSMTEMFVPFESVIKFKKPRSGTQGTLILKKDNPTDRPELDDALEIPVLF